MEIKDIFTVVGIPSIVVGLVYIGAKLQILNDLKGTIEKIKNNIKVITDTLIKSDLPFYGEKLQTYSPINLTEKGQTFLSDVGFIKLFEDNKNDFFNYIDSEKPKTDYDIENVALRSVFFLFDKDYFNPIKEHLYNNPKDTKNDFIRVAGIYVRNKYNDKQKDNSKNTS